MRFLSNKKTAAFGNLAIKSPEDIEKEQALKEENLQKYGLQDPEDSSQFVSMPSSNYDSDEEVQSEEEDEVVEIPEESNISKSLSDSTTKTVIMLVLTLLVMQSACNTESYIDVTHVHK